MLGILILGKIPFEGDVGIIALGILGVALIALYLFFFFEKISFKLLKRLKWYEYLSTIVANYPTFRKSLLLLSLLRHFVFTLQFWLLLHAFSVQVSLVSFFWIWQVFLWTTLVPSLWFGKLLIRESIALFVLGGIGLNRVDILATSLLLWFVNLGLPALLGVIICKKSDVRS